jgi:hypothetical protein
MKAEPEKGSGHVYGGALLPISAQVDLFLMTSPSMGTLRANGKKSLPAWMHGCVTNTEKKPREKWPEARENVRPGVTLPRAFASAGSDITPACRAVYLNTDFKKI